MRTHNVFIRNFKIEGIWIISIINVQVSIFLIRKRFSHTYFSTYTCYSQYKVGLLKPFR